MTTSRQPSASISLIASRTLGTAPSYRGAAVRDSCGPQILDPTIVLTWPDERLDLVGEGDTAQISLRRSPIQGFRRRVIGEPGGRWSSPDTPPAFAPGGGGSRAGGKHRLGSAARPFACPRSTAAWRHSNGPQPAPIWRSSSPIPTPSRPAMTSPRRRHGLSPSSSRGGTSSRTDAATWMTAALLGSGGGPEGARASRPRGRRGLSPLGVSRD